MRITVNGEYCDVPDSLTVAELVTQRFGARTGIAIAVGGELAPRSEWESFALTDGAVVEVLVAVQGG